MCVCVLLSHVTIIVTTTIIMTNKYMHRCICGCMCILTVVLALMFVVLVCCVSLGISIVDINSN